MEATDVNSWLLSQNATCSAHLVRGSWLVTITSRLGGGDFYQAAPHHDLVEAVKAAMMGFADASSLAANHEQGFYEAR
jgi:hypothetical protein